MKPLNYFLSFLFLQALTCSCGKKLGDSPEKCFSQYAKVEQCKADLAASRYYTSQYQADLDETNCYRKYPVKACYSEKD